jgi:glutamine amidotransferase
MLISVIDLEINNLNSVVNSFSKHTKSSDLVEILNPESEERHDLLILPGLGKFSAGINQLRKFKLDEKIKLWSNLGTKVVGICLGMQLLGESSSESPGELGLNLIPGHCEKLKLNKDERIPHIGWNSIKAAETSDFLSLSSNKDFYFVHSYHFVAEESTHVLGTTPFGDGRFNSVIANENILGFQFHPEKSGYIGQNLIADVIEWSR